MKCKNCEYNLSGNFCSNCGQKSIQSRISFAQFKEQMVELLNLNGNFFHTLVTLIFNPKTLISDYLNGKRKPYTKPIKFVFILSTINVILLTFFYFNTEDTTITIMNKPFWIPLFVTNSVLVFTFLSFFFFKSRLNVFENLTINLYLLGVLELISTVNSMLKVLFSFIDINIYFSILAFVSQFLFMVYFYNSIFKKNIHFIVLISFFCFIISYTVLFFLLMSFGYNFK